MKSGEKLTAAKSARLMRAMRKELGLSQQQVAAELQISQGTLSKMENQLLMPSAHEWLSFCVLAKIPPDSLLTGTLDSLTPVQLISGELSSGFRIPAKFLRDRASKVRAAIPFFRFLELKLGPKKSSEYLRSIKIDPDYFVDLDHELNLLFGLEVARFLSAKGLLTPADISQMTESVALPEVQGRLYANYEAEKTTLPRIQMLISNARFYEGNFDYQLEAASANRIEFSIKPNPHLEVFGVAHDDELGDFLCTYKKSYFTHFADHKKVRLNEVECQFHGAQKCVYQMKMAG